MNAESRSGDAFISWFSATRFAHLSRFSAGIVLVGLLLAITVCLLFSRETPHESGASTDGPDDATLYRSIIARMRAGESYYPAAASELRKQPYGMKSVFNWRPPMLAILISGLPSDAWGRAILASIAIATVVIARVAARRHGKLVGILVPISIFYGGMLNCFSRNGVYFSELWAGTLICLSVCCYGAGWWIVGAVAGFVALLMRELAAPYVIIAFAIALWRMRRTEIVVWLIGFAAYACIFAMHTSAVHRQIRPEDFSDPQGWFQLGGIRFILATAHWNGIIEHLPLWTTAILLPIALLSLVAARSEVGFRAATAVVIYLLLFAFVGRPFNDYWGMLYIATLSIGIGWSIDVFRDLFTSLARRSG
jgi:hypothetical protein